MEDSDIQSVSHGLLIGMENHPCLKVCCENKNCIIGSWLRKCHAKNKDDSSKSSSSSSSSSDRYSWNQLLTIPIELEGLHKVHPRNPKQKESFKIYEKLRLHYYTSRRVLLQVQNSFKSRQKVEFAALLKFQQKMRSELVTCRERVDKIERDILNIIDKDDTDMYSSVVRTSITFRKKGELQDESETKKEDRTSSSCPEGFDMKEWLKLSSEARHIVMDQFKNAVYVEIARLKPEDDTKDSKNMFENQEEEDENFDEDIAILEEEASMGSSSKLKSNESKQSNIAEVLELYVNNMDSMV